MFCHSTRFDATRIKMGFAEIQQNSKQQKHKKSDCLNTGVRKIPESTLCIYVLVQLPCMMLEQLTAKNLKIRTKSAYALLNNVKTGKMKTERLSCLSSAFIQNSTRPITSLTIITDSETFVMNFVVSHSGCGRSVIDA
jgi:hypothetical protein